METRAQYVLRLKREGKELTKFSLEIDNFSKNKKKWVNWGQSMELE